MSGHLLIAIDPGNQQSAYCVVDRERRPGPFDIVPNDVLLSLIETADDFWEAEYVAIEMVASYGMAVGADVFETCVWTGRFIQQFAQHSHEPELIKRHPVKVHHCHSAKATDANIRQALVDRFASGVSNHGKGSKATPGWFYGFAKDIWAAYALAVYAADQHWPRTLPEQLPVEAEAVLL